MSFEEEFQALRVGGCAWSDPTPLEETSLDKGTLSRLRNAGYRTVGDVLALKPGQLMGKEGVWGFGKSALAELCRALASREPASPPDRKLSVTERSRLIRAVELLEEYESLVPDKYLDRVAAILERRRSGSEEAPRATWTSYRTASWRGSPRT